MKKSKIILLFKIILLLILFVYIFNCFKNKNDLSKYDGSETTFTGFIKEIEVNDNKLTLTIKAKENLLINYYFDNEDNKFLDYKIGDYVSVSGKLILPNKNSNFKLFNYRNYLLSKKIYYIVKADSIKKIKNNNKIHYLIKQKIINHINSIPNNSYLKSFILGDNSSIPEETLSSYRQNGISHLFAVSGMHVTLLSSFLLKLLNKINKKELVNEIIVMAFLLFYMFIVSFSVSIIRATLMIVLAKLSKLLNIKLKTIEIFILVLIITLFLNPFYLFSISFQFSFIVSLYLIVFSNLINNSDNYLKKIFLTSFIAFLAGIPIQINNFFSINFLSVLFNLIFVPFFSIIIFPFSLITFIFPFLIYILSLFINIFECISNFFSNISCFNITLSHMPIYVFISYYILITLILFYIRKKTYFPILILFFVLFIHYNIIVFINYHVLTFVDVGQGDSTLIKLKNGKGNILIDTGGIINYNSSSNYSLTLQTIIPYLKSVGIKSLNYLVITHGDYDHMGEAINLVENFKVEKVIFNCGDFNELEQNLIKVLDKKKIPYYSCIKELNINDNKLYFLNNKDYGNENDNSSIIYTELNNHKFLFMGDAGVEVEEDLIRKYNLQDIDVLKVGHHGSRTSSSIEFINEINPKYSIISIGKNNRYGHPNKEVLENLSDSKIYRTDKDGSIMLKIKNNKLKIEACEP